MSNDLLNRKTQLEERLIKHGINGYRITHLPYLEYDDVTFATPCEAGLRLLVLCAVAYCAAVPDEREVIVQWLEREHLWEHVSPNEKRLFTGEVTDGQEIIDFSWEMESAYLLAWALNVVPVPPDPASTTSDDLLDYFVDHIPMLGDETTFFLQGLSYRSLAEIYDENLFYEMVTGYFRDNALMGREDTSDIHNPLSFTRHKTLNWLRRFVDVTEWDDTDTST